MEVILERESLEVFSSSVEEIQKAIHEGKMYCLVSFIQDPEDNRISLYMKDLSEFLLSSSVEAQKEHRKQVTKVLNSSIEEPAFRVFIRILSSNLITKSHLNNLFLKYSEQGDEELINILIECGANIDAVNAKLERPIHLAVKKQNLSVVQKLIDSGAAVFVEDIEGNTPLHLAAMNSNDSLIETLLNENNSKEFFFHRNMKGYTALDLTVDSLVTPAYIKLISAMPREDLMELPRPKEEQSSCIVM